MGAALAAAQAASAGAHREAPSHLETMLEYAGSLAQADRARLLEQLAYECYLIGRYSRASAARREALQIWRASGARPQEGDTLHWLSRLSWHEGRRAEADRYCVRGNRGARVAAALTRREAQILALMRDGLRNAAIARHLFLSTRTVDHHVSAVLAKLGATSRTQAVEIARRGPEAAED
jgi:DNA-binding CsgD family transcriptional regulator